MVADIYSGTGSSQPRYLTVHDGRLFFAARDADHGNELWQYDGTTASMAADVEPGTSGSYPRYMTTGDGGLYFSADTRDYGREPWQYDGTTACCSTTPTRTATPWRRDGGGTPTTVRCP